MLSIRQLQIFQAVADSASFVEASQALHLTSSALSAAVKAMEARLGFRLFERTTRMVRLTAEGDRLLNAAREVLHRQDELLRVIDSVRRHHCGSVRIAATQLLSSTLLPPAIGHFRRQRPDLEVVQVPTLYDDFQDLLVRESVEFAIGPERLCGAGIEAEPVFTAGLNLICGRRHRLARRRSVRWRELRCERVFLIDKRGAAWLERSSGFQMSFDRTLDVGHFSSALALTAEGEGVMIAPEFTRMLLRPYPLAMVPLVEPEATRVFMLYRNTRTPQSQQARQLSDYLKEHWAAGAAGAAPKAPRRRGATPP